jgi:sugar O-acyltransferase (sialic acid O-acetyltransferase NeuD family)
MALPLVIHGAGGFGREVLDVVDAVNGLRPAEPYWDFLGFVDAGDVDTYGRGSLIQASDVVGQAGLHYVVAIGDPATRERVVAGASGSPATLVHPSATLGSDVAVGGGSVICAGVRITTNVRVGHHVHLNLNSTVGHDAVIGDYATIFPGVNLSGSTLIGSGVSLGTNSAILQGLTVGPGAFVAAGAVVVGDVPAGVTAKGVPARW